MLRYNPHQLGEQMLRVIQNENKCRELINFLLQKKQEHNNSNQPQSQQQNSTNILQINGCRFAEQNENQIQYQQACLSFINNDKTINNGNNYINNYINNNYQHYQQQQQQAMNEFLYQQQKYNNNSNKKNKINSNVDCKTEDVNNDNSYKKKKLVSNVSIITDKHQEQQLKSQYRYKQTQQEEQQYFDLILILNDDYTKDNMQQQNIQQSYYHNDQDNQQHLHQVKVYQQPKSSIKFSNNSSCFNLSNFNSFNNNNSNNNSSNKSSQQLSQQLQQTTTINKFYQQQLVYLIKKIQLTYGKKLSPSGIKKIINQLSTIAGINHHQQQQLDYVMNCNSSVKQQDKLNGVTTQRQNNTFYYDSDKHKHKDKNKNKDKDKDKNNRYLHLFNNRLKDLTNVTNNIKINNINSSNNNNINSSNNNNLIITTTTKDKSKSKPINKINTNQSSSFNSSNNNNNKQNKKIKFSTLPQQSSSSLKISNNPPKTKVNYASRQLQQQRDKQNSFIIQQQNDKITKTQKSTILKDKQRSLSPLSYRVLMEKKRQLKQSQKIQKTQKKGQQQKISINSIKKTNNKNNNNNKENHQPQQTSQISYDESSNIPIQLTTPYHHHQKLPQQQQKTNSLKIILQKPLTTNSHNNNYSKLIKNNKTKTLTFEYQQNISPIQIKRQIQKYCQQQQINKKNMNIILEAVNQHKPILTLKCVQQ